MQLNTITPFQSNIPESAQKEFSIAVNANSFKILSSNLYSNKPLAIIRELSANAIDAHKSIGKVKPFSLALPNSLNPNFYIRDFGPGLSEEAVNCIYTSYFTSTKTSSNEQIGGFGLGSKTPFSYTPTFGVRSFYKGNVTTYIMTLNEKSVPVVIKMGTMPTDEESGLEITFAVSSNDFMSFAEAAKLAFQDFPVEYLPSSVSSYRNYDKFINISSNVRWQPKIHNYHHDVEILYSFYRYSLNSESMIQSVSAQKKDIIKKFLREASNLTFVFDVGEIDISASRESIEFTEKTVNAIIKAIDNLSSTLKEEIKDIPSTPSLFELKKYDIFKTKYASTLNFSKIINDYSSLLYACDIIPSSKWVGSFAQSVLNSKIISRRSHNKPAAKKFANNLLDSLNSRSFLGSDCIMNVPAVFVSSEEEIYGKPQNIQVSYECIVFCNSEDFNIIKRHFEHIRTASLTDPTIPNRSFYSEERFFTEEEYLNLFPQKKDLEKQFSRVSIDDERLKVDILIGNSQFQYSKTGKIKIPKKQKEKYLFIKDADSLSSFLKKTFIGDEFAFFLSKKYNAIHGVYQINDYSLQFLKENSKAQFEEVCDLKKEFVSFCGENPKVLNNIFDLCVYQVIFDKLCTKEYNYEQDLCINVQKAIESIEPILKKEITIDPEVEMILCEYRNILNLHPVNLQNGRNQKRYYDSNFLKGLVDMCMGANFSDNYINNLIQLIEKALKTNLFNQSTIKAVAGAAPLLLNSISI